MYSATRQWRLQHCCVELSWRNRVRWRGNSVFAAWSDRAMPVLGKTISTWTCWETINGNLIVVIYKFSWLICVWFSCRSKCVDLNVSVPEKATSPSKTALVVQCSSNVADHSKRINSKERCIDVLRATPTGMLADDARNPWGFQCAESTRTTTVTESPSSGSISVGDEACEYRFRNIS